MISEQPSEADDRAVPGHSEGDLITGKDSGSAIGTSVEHSTRFVMLLHLPARRSTEQVRNALMFSIDGPHLPTQGMMAAFLHHQLVVEVIGSNRRHAREESEGIGLNHDR